MKKPKRKGVDKLNFGRNMSFTAGVENGRVYGYNGACDDWEKYYASKEQRIKELECILGAWHNIFGTTQLTHADDRLRVAEEKASKISSVERISQCPHCLCMTKNICGKCKKEKSHDERM